MTEKERLDKLIELTYWLTRSIYVLYRMSPSGSNPDQGGLMRLAQDLVDTLEESAKRSPRLDKE